MITILLLIGSLLDRSKGIYFIGGDNLPEPLSKEMEEFYVGLKEDGDLKAQDILVERNLRLVVYLAKKYQASNVDLEDLISIGTVGLIKGIKTFHSGKNIRLATYASRCIDNEILMFLRKNKKIKCEVSFDESLSFDAEGNELHLEDVLGTEKDLVTRNIEEVDEKKILINEIKELNPRERDIMVLRYGLMGNKAKTQKEVADFLGISQSYISRIEKKVIKRLKTLVNYT